MLFCFIRFLYYFFRALVAYLSLSCTVGNSERIEWWTRRRHKAQSFEIKHFVRSLAGLLSASTRIYIQSSLFILLLFFVGFRRIQSINIFIRIKTEAKQYIFNFPFVSIIIFQPFCLTVSIRRTFLSFTGEIKAHFCPLISCQLELNAICQRHMNSSAYYYVMTSTSLSSMVHCVLVNTISVHKCGSLRLRTSISLSKSMQPVANSVAFSFTFPFINGNNTKWM